MRLRDAAIVGQSGDLTFNGAADRLEALGIELAVDVAHPGSVVDPGLPGGRLPQGLEIGQAVVAPNEIHSTADPAGEDINRLTGCGGHQLRVVQALP